MSRWGRAIAGSIAVSCLTAVTGAQADPWIGRWGAPDCSKDATTIIITRTKLDLSTFDMVCEISEVQQREGLFVLNTTCPESGLAANALFYIRVDGEGLEFVRQQQGLEFDPKRFQRCASRK